MADRPHNFAQEVKEELRLVHAQMVLYRAALHRQREQARALLTRVERLERSAGIAVGEPESEAA